MKKDVKIVWLKVLKRLESKMRNTQTNFLWEKLKKKKNNKCGLKKKRMSGEDDQLVIFLIWPKRRGCFLGFM